jgi:hypothetical protein
LALLKREENFLILFPNLLLVADFLTGVVTVSLHSEIKELDTTTEGSSKIYEEKST